MMNLIQRVHSHVQPNPTRRNILTSLPGYRSMASRDYVRSEITARMRETGLVVVADGRLPSEQLSGAIGRKVKK